MRKINSIAVVGGGTAGLVAALILKGRFPEVSVGIVKSAKIGIIGVGEGSTEHWTDFLKFLDVHFTEMIKKCDATFKCGIMFRNWAEKDYMHSVDSSWSSVPNAQHTPMAHKLIIDNASNKEFNPSLSWDNRIVWSSDDASELSKKQKYNQFHFNTHKLNEFLINVALNNGIEIQDDEINDVILNDRGEIDFIVGEKKTYKSDFFIDSTGFKRILISKLGAKWQSYSQYLKMKSAIVFPLGDTDEYNIWTLSQAMQYGWMFKIPVWGRSGNGYIFDSDYITAEQAKEEVEKFLGHEIHVSKVLKFDPGALDSVWIKNCCAVGLSASFVEPLEATSIGTSIQQVFLLMHRLPNYDEATIDKYNKDVNDILLNIRDYIILHYITKKNNSPFWKDIQSITLPHSLVSNLAKWHKNLPIADDFAGETAYKLFGPSNYTQILAGLKLFDIDSIKTEYEMMHPAIKQRVETAIRERRSLETIYTSISHKQYIEHIRNL